MGTDKLINDITVLYFVPTYQDYRKVYCDTVDFIKNYRDQRNTLDILSKHKYYYIIIIQILCSKHNLCKNNNYDEFEWMAFF